MSIVAVFGLLSVNPCARAKGALCVHGGSPSGCRPASRPAPAHCFPGLASAGACHRHTYSILPAARAGSQCQRLRHPAGLLAHAMSCPHVHSVSEALLSLLPALFDSPPAPCSDSAAGHHWPAPDTAMQRIQEIPRHTGEAYLFRCVRVTLQSLLTVPTLPCKCCALARDDSLHPMACSPHQCDHDAWFRDANSGVRCVHRHKPELSNMYDLDWFLQPTLADGNCLPDTLAQCTQRLKKLFAVQQWGDLPSDFPSTHQEWRAFLVQEIQSHESTFEWAPGALMDEFRMEGPAHARVQVRNTFADVLYHHRFGLRNDGEWMSDRPNLFLLPRNSPPSKCQDIVTVMAMQFRCDSGMCGTRLSINRGESRLCHQPGSANGNLLGLSQICA